jgi:hypothetical protein
MAQEFDGGVVFMDVHSIEPAVDFKNRILERVRAAKIILVVIGRDWAGVDPATGSRRIDDPHDFVHIEVAEALRLAGPDRHVLPVLAEGAILPRDLPEALSKLTAHQAESLDTRDFVTDANRIINWLKTQVPPNPRIRLLRALKEIGVPLSWLSPAARFLGRPGPAIAALILLAAFCAGSAGLAWRSVMKEKDAQISAAIEDAYRKAERKRLNQLEGIVVITTPEGPAAVENADVYARDAKNPKKDARVVTDSLGKYSLDLTPLGFDRKDVIQIEAAKGAKTDKANFTFEDGLRHRLLLK